MHFEMCLEVTEQSELLVAQITVVWFVAYTDTSVSTLAYCCQAIMLY